jgi:hypothetical protein
MKKLPKFDQLNESLRPINEAGNRSDIIKMVDKVMALMQKINIAMEHDVDDIIDAEIKFHYNKDIVTHTYRSSNSVEPQRGAVDYYNALTGRASGQKMDVSFIIRELKKLRAELAKDESGARSNTKADEFVVLYRKLMNLADFLESLSGPNFRRTVGTANFIFRISDKSMTLTGTNPLHLETDDNNITVGEFIKVIGDYISSKFDCWVVIRFTSKKDDGGLPSANDPIVYDNRKRSKIKIEMVYFDVDYYFDMRRLDVDGYQTLDDLVSSGSDQPALYNQKITVKL